MAKFQALHQSIKIRLLLQFATILASTTIMPFIAIYFTSLVGAKITGLLVVIVILAGITGGFLGGFWSDQIGRKKLLVLAELGLGISFLAIAFVNSAWAVLPYVSFVLFIINMFCNGIYIPVSTSMIHDLVKKEERNFVFTAVYWIGNLGSALGSITGAFLFEDYHFYLFLSVAGITMLASLITYLFIGETFIKPAEYESTTSPTIWANYKKVFQDHTYIIFLIATLCVVSLESHLTNYIAVHLEKNVEETSLFGLFTIDGINLVGVLHAENTLLVVVAVGIVSSMVKNLSDHTRMLFGMSLYVCCYAALSFAAMPIVLLGLMVFISIGELMYIPVKQSLLAELAVDSRRSSYLALHSFMGQGTMIIAGAAITLGSIIPPAVMSSTFLAIGLIGVSLMAFVIRRVQQSHGTTGILSKDIE
ncbi:MFS transporter [Virgibacillus siamensis]|uniref:MFS transporter n=1 Tax=Virgibacillus siamensis TaxID=480071 RepID=A0ABN1FPD1_9BACI